MHSPDEDHEPTSRNKFVSTGTEDGAPEETANADMSASCVDRRDIQRPDVTRGLVEATRRSAKTRIQTSDTKTTTLTDFTIVFKVCYYFHDNHLQYPVESSTDSLTTKSQLLIEQNSQSAKSGQVFAVEPRTYRISLCKSGTIPAIQC